MSVKISIGLVEHRGTTSTVRGEEPFWRVTFKIDAQKINFDLPLEVTAQSMVEAEARAINELRLFSGEFANAASELKPTNSV